MISASSEQVGRGVELVGETGKVLQGIAVNVTEIDGLVAQMATSAEEQAVGLNQVNAAVNQMDQVVQQNAAMVEQSTAASHALKTETAELARLIAGFKIAGSGAAVQAGARSTPHAAEGRARRSLPRARGAAAVAEDAWQEF